MSNKNGNTNLSSDKDKEKSKPDKTTVEITTYGYNEFNKPILILILKDVTY